MQTRTFSIPNISCGHCVMTIKREIGELEGIFKVDGNPAAKEITVEWDAPATQEKIKSVLKEIDYPAVD